MDIDNLGYGAGGGLLSAFLIALGLKSRMDKQDDRIDKQDIEIKDLKKSVVSVDAFEQFEKRFETVTEKMDRIGDRIDTLIAHVIRQEKVIKNENRV